MTVRVWGEVDDRLVEVRASSRACVDVGIRIVGLPPARSRTTGDRVRAALLNAGLLDDGPGVSVMVEPPLAAGESWVLDLAIALAVLGSRGRLAPGLGWIVATGRLGPDGSVYAPDRSESTSLAAVVGSLCRWEVLR